MPYTSTQPSSVRVPTAQNYVSTLDFIHRPDVAPYLVQRYGDQMTLMDFFQFAGMLIPTSAEQYEHKEEDWIEQFNTVLAVTSAPASPGDPVSFTIPVAEHRAGLSYGRLNRIVQFQGSNIIGTITAIDTTNPTAHIYTIAPNQVTDDLTGTITSGDAIIYTGNTFAEGTGTGNGITPDAITYRNNTMIIKEKYEVTGSEATNMSWIEVANADGSTGYLWYLKGERDTYTRFQDATTLALLISEPITNTAEFTALSGINGSLPRSTKGLFPEIRDLGNTLNYSQNTWDLTQLDIVIDQLDRERGAPEYSVPCGTDWYKESDDFLYDLFQNGAVSYGAFNGQKEIAISLGFSSFNRRGYNFHFKKFDGFNHPQSLGAPGFEYPGMAVFIPMDQQLDTATNEKVPSLGIRYKTDGQGYDRDIKHWYTGSVNIETPTDDVDVLRTHYLTDKGIDLYGGNRFFLVERV